MTVACVCASIAVSVRRKGLWHVFVLLPQCLRDECDCDVCLCFYRSVCETNVTVACVCASTAVSVRRM